MPPVPSPAIQAPAGEVQAELILHTVESKETLFAIARKYGVAVEDIMRWNDMTTTGLKIGQQLRIHKKTTNAD